MVKHTQTQQKLTNYLSVFDHFLGLALKGLILFLSFQTNYYDNLIGQVLFMTLD